MTRYSSFLFAVTAAAVTFTGVSCVSQPSADKKDSFDISKAPVYTDVPEGFDELHNGVSYGTIKNVTYHSETTGSDRKCNILLPPDYDTNRKYPVLYLLHGIGGTHTEWLGGNPVAVVGNAIHAGAVPTIVVMPNARAEKDDSVPANIFSDEAVAAFDNFINDLFNDLMPYVEKNFPVLTGQKNTAIAGLSMGGRESLFIGFKRPESFCAVGAFSPAPGLLPQPSMHMVGQLQPDQFKFADGIHKPSLLLICCGTEDSVVRNVPLSYHDVLVKNNVKHFWYTMPGDHNFVVWKNGLYNFCMREFRN